MAARFDTGRRGVLGGAVALAAAGLAVARLGQAASKTPAVRGRLKQSVSRWCFGKMTLDELCGHAARIGYKGIDLLEPKDWPIVRKHGLVCPLGSLGGPVTIEKGLNRVENHGPILDALAKGIDLAAEAQVPNLVCFSGNRRGMSDGEGLANCVAGLPQITPLAERPGRHGVHGAAQQQGRTTRTTCATTRRGASSWSKQVGSPRFKLLYDIYHMQIMEGDVIRTIRENARAIGHYHTGGNPAGTRSTRPRS